MIELLVNAAPGETRIALVEDGVLADYQVERAGETALTGNVYLGRVTRVMPAMQAAFVEIGEARAGFLALSEARHLAKKADPNISDCVREGEALAVQVIREGEGDKGPRLTAKVPLQADAKAVSPPALLMRAPTLLHRLLRDLPDTISRIAIDDARTAAAVRDYCRAARPELETKIEIARDVFPDSLEDDIARLSASRVALGNGGWITIERTEGFTAIDVNSGGFAAPGGREQTALAVNLEAAQEIGRQLRLRGIGGLIVADFIQMDTAASTKMVEAVLTQSLGDAAPADVSLTRTALAVITRKRVRPPLSRFSEPCTCCNGTGARPGAESIALALLRAAERSARAAPGRPLIARAAPEVTDWLADHAAAWPVMARLRLEPTSGPREAFDVFAG